MPWLLLSRRLAGGAFFVFLLEPVEGFHFRFAATEFPKVGIGVVFKVFVASCGDLLGDRVSVGGVCCDRCERDERERDHESFRHLSCLPHLCPAYTRHADGTPCPKDVMVMSWCCNKKARYDGHFFCGSEGNTAAARASRKCPKLRPVLRAGFLGAIEDRNAGPARGGEEPFGRSDRAMGKDAAGIGIARVKLVG